MRQQCPNLEEKEFRTSISDITPDKIIVRGYLLPDLIGNVPFGDASFLVLTGRLPNKSESRIFNAILVALIEHGITTQAFAARWIIRTAPEAVQGAIASAILGVGDQFGGAAEKVGEMLSSASSLFTERGMTVDQVAEHVIQDYAQRKKNIPGIGHNVHKHKDPRAAKLMVVAEEEGLPGNNLKLLQAILGKLNEAKGRDLEINVMGAIGAIVLDIGLDWRLAKGLMVTSKVPGILAHINEETKRPIMGEMTNHIRSIVKYDGPAEK